MYHIPSNGGDRAELQTAGKENIGDPLVVAGSNVNVDEEGICTPDHAQPGVFLTVNADLEDEGERKEAKGNVGVQIAGMVASGLSIIGPSLFM